MLLRLATLWTSGRLSRNKGRVRTMLKLKRLPTHITPEVLNSLTGLERVGPRREFNVANRPDGADSVV